MAADKGKGWDGSLKDLQARIDALARRKVEGKSDEGAPSAEVAPALRAHRSPTSAAGGSPIVYRRDLPRRAAPSLGSPRPAGERIPLEEAFEGREVASGEAGQAFVISTPVDRLEGAKGFSARFGKRLAEAESALSRRLVTATGLEQVTAGDLVFFDIESTGLAYAPLFLIGAMVWEGDALVVHQYMARTYAEEAAVIALFADLCKGHRLLVSFNGKSYDLPTIKVRGAANRVDVTAVPPNHYDLLHECRRVWRHVLPDCRLQTLELHVCKRLRRGDIPSAEIPRAYHAYVRSADAWEMVEAVKHNMLDLVTLADLMTRLPPLEEPETAG